MQSQPTLEELKRRWDEAFAAADATIEDARRVVRNCRELNAELKRTRDDLCQQKRRFLKIADKA